MKHIFRKYTEMVLVTLAIIFLAVLFGSFSWGIGVAVQEVNRAVQAAGAGSGNASFNLDGARALDLRGLVKP